MLAGELRSEGMSPIIIEALDDMEVNDFSFIDISMLIVERLAKYANENGININNKIVSAFRKALSTKTTDEYWERYTGADLEAGASGTIRGAIDDF